jgi:hypothetical protein
MQDIAGSAFEELSDSSLEWSIQHRQALSLAIKSLDLKYICTLLLQQDLRPASTFEIDIPRVFARVGFDLTDPARDQISRTTRLAFTIDS